MRFTPSRTPTAVGQPDLADAGPRISLLASAVLLATLPLQVFPACDFVPSLCPVPCCPFSVRGWMGRRSPRTPAGRTPTHALWPLPQACFLSPSLTPMSRNGARRPCSHIMSALVISAVVKWHLFFFKTGTHRGFKRHRDGMLGRELTVRTGEAL